MNFDTVIIGGGLAGLVCGLSLSRQGQRCAIVSSGQSALHFSSGSLDLLNVLPDGTAVEHPLEAVKDLIAQAPAHPYAKLGIEKFKALAKQAEHFFGENGITVSGSAEENHYRVTPMGTLKSTWLTLGDQLACSSARCLPWKKIAIFNVKGFLDFYSQFIADEFWKMGTESRIHLFSFEALERLRQNPSEMRSANIARVFRDKENLAALVRILKAESGDCEAIVLPAVFGLEDCGVLKELKEAVDKEVCLLPTLPPSVPGIRTQQQLCRSFRQAGGMYLLGDSVLRAEKEKGRITKLYTCNHGDIPLVGKNVVLASGSYFSRGLAATSERVYEPVFDLDVVYAPNRSEWYELDMFAAQPYEAFGIRTDRQFRGLYQGKALENLYVAGAGLEGFNAIREGCGAGVSVLTGLYVAERILNQ